MKNLRAKPQFDINQTAIRSEAQHAFYAKCAMSLFKGCRTMFQTSEINLIEGTLRRGDLSCCQSPLISRKLEEAKALGNMDVNSFAALYQFYSFTKKLPQKGNDRECRLAGLAKLEAGEAKCLVTNMTMDCRVDNNFQLFDRVKRIISDVLGPVPTTIFTQSEVSFGPGSTVNAQARSYEQTSHFYKITDRLVVPNRAKYYLAALVSAHPNWVNLLACHYHTQRASDESNINFEMRVFDMHFDVVPDDFPSRIGFVPKDSAEHRAIGIELNGLVPLQKAVGDLIRKQLKRCGINLDSQDRNRHLAKLARTFELATIDLANASSSISLELVRAIFPKEWFILFETFRSTCGESRDLDVKITYEMISSMGNGFTFELESLIFYALAKATCVENGVSDFEVKRSVSVFGDDIIIPQRVCSSFFDNLTLFGFTPNVEKSFTQGFFFESCGADYYDGFDVRPFLLRREVQSFKDVVFLLNSILFKVIQQNRCHLFGLYLYVFKQLGNWCPSGPLHFEQIEKHGRMVTDDLEAVLRVPLEFAQKRGGVVFDYDLYAWAYTRWVQIGVSDPLGDSPQYAVKHARYFTFLKGNEKGKVLLRGRVRTRQVRTVSSQWDGILSIGATRTVKALFDNL